MICLIDGYWGTGKSTLRGLLDGHPDLFVSPVQDSVVGAFSKDSEVAEWMACKDITTLRRLLAQSGYYKYERYAANEVAHFEFSKKDRVIRPFIFDFYEYERAWRKEMRSFDEWSPKNITEAIYQNLPCFWKNWSQLKSDIKYHVSLEDNAPTCPKFFMEHFPDGKYIYVMRSPEGIVSTRAGRIINQDMYMSVKYTPDLTVHNMIRNGVVQQIIKEQEAVEELQKQFPDRILITKFEEFAINPEATMRNVASFLGIPFTNDMLVFSYLGEEVVGANGQKFIGKVNDDPQEILTAHDFSAIQRIKENKPLPLSVLRRFLSRSIRFVSNKLLVAARHLSPL